MIKKINKNNKAGFTLIEFVIYIGLFSILLLITLQMFASIFDLQLESEATSAVSEDGKYLLQRFTYDANAASDISDPSIYGVPSGTLTFVVNGENLIYSLNSGNLVLENETLGTTDQLNSFGTSVTDVTFIKLDGNGVDSVQINFTLTSDVKRVGGAEVKVFQTTVGLR